MKSVLFYNRLILNSRYEIEFNLYISFFNSILIFSWHEFRTVEIVKLFQNDDMLKLFQLSILFVLLVSSSPDLFAQQITDTSKVLVKFNEPMSRDGIFNTDNYIIFRDDEIPIAIYKIGIVAGDTAIILYTEKHFPQFTYKLIINNLRDKAGNIISENHKLAFY